MLAFPANTLTESEPGLRISRGASMRVLIMSAIYPTPEKPAWGTFIRTEVEALKHAGVDVAASADWRLSQMELSESHVSIAPRSCLEHH